MLEAEPGAVPGFCPFFLPQNSSKIPPQNEFLNSAKFAGGYGLSNLFVFSFEPRCQGD
ncbi:TPA: hypothetical protein QCJ61_003002 [Enterobacter asburiae]|nr:hypothetical protein [Enterobacter asburiae]HDR2805877.1 hypothetical protein [Enterobacter asburiae]HDR2810571.1 hypothetical protein [Enterobacter asburiae]HDR2815947.1 hypothetical protein [Enterobacter asburiae]